MKDSTTNKNILHVINIFFSLSYLGNQFKHFTDKGYKQHLICSPSSQLSEYAKIQDIQYEEINIIRKISPLKDIVSLFKIFRYILKNEIGIVVGHTPKGALLAMVSSFILQVPVRIYFRHGLVYETMTGFPRLIMINIDRITAYCATKIVCVSPSLAKQSLEDNLNSEKKQIILGRGTCSGIDALGKFNPKLIDKTSVNQLRESLAIANDTFVIGYCGRLVKDKGIVELVQAFNLVKIKFPKAVLKLLLIGDFEERDSLPVDIIQEIKSNSDIICTGFVYDAIQNYYSLMDVFILPSYREGFPTVVLESSSLEIPVLTTKVTGCIDSVLDGITGFYVNNEKESIAIGISNLINNPKIKEYGINGRKMVLESYENSLIWQLIESELYTNPSN